MENSRDYDYAVNERIKEQAPLSTFGGAGFPLKQNNISLSRIAKGR